MFFTTDKISLATMSELPDTETLLMTTNGWLKNQERQKVTRKKIIEIKTQIIIRARSRRAAKLPDRLVL